MAKKASKKKVEKESINESPENQVEDLKLEDQLKEEKDKFLRLFAEFENYKRRTAKERIELFSTARPRKASYNPGTYVKKETLASPGGQTRISKIAPAKISNTKIISIASARSTKRSQRKPFKTASQRNPNIRI